MSMTPLAGSNDHGCLDAELLASYVEGRTTAVERSAVEAHLAGCEDCYFAFAETVREQAHGAVASRKGERRAWLPWAATGLAAAAAVVIAVVLGTNYSRPASDLTVALNELDAAAGPYRRFEPRLTVNRIHHPLQPAMRSGASTDEASVAVREAALKVELAAKMAAAAERQRALAATYLAQGQAARAAAVAAPLASTNEAGLLNDTAAAYLARNSEGDAKYALDLLERAVRIDAERPEAWFNLGLAAEATGQIARAREAWTKYLALDSSSEWAGEARRHLDKLKQEQPPPLSRFVQVAPIDRP